MPGQGWSSVKPAISGADVSHADHRRSGWREQFQARSGEAWGGNAGWWQSEPDVGRVADGVAARVDRLKAIGNGQVPLCAATAWRLLT
jgi:DNA (cytosine-5)-methyltransferase 1